MKKFCIAFAMIALFFCFTISPASAQTNGKCAELFYDWSGTGNYNSAYIWFDANGTFNTIEALPQTGVWYDNSGSRVWIYDDAPHAFYAGKKTRGYMRNDSTVWGGLPGLWYTKGTKKTNCGITRMSSASFQSSEGGPSSNSPE